MRAMTAIYSHADPVDGEQGRVKTKACEVCVSSQGGSRGNMVELKILGQNVTQYVDWQHGRVKTYLRARLTGNMVELKRECLSHHSFHRF